MTSSITLRGGTTATRLKLLHSRTNELILQFMEEGHTNSAPIQYSLMPIWQIIGANQTYEVQAINLQYYFDGFLNFGCSYLPGTLYFIKYFILYSKNDIVYRGG